MNGSFQIVVAGIYYGSVEIDCANNIAFKIQLENLIAQIRSYAVGAIEKEIADGNPATKPQGH